jgi:hypothetical protein
MPKASAVDPNPPVTHESGGGRLPGVSLPTLRVLLHREADLGVWVARALECDLVAQGAQQLDAIGGLLRQVAAVAWMRLHGEAAPRAAPAPLHVSWLKARPHALDEPLPACLLHDRSGVRQVHVPLEIRRIPSGAQRLPGDPTTAPTGVQLAISLKRRGAALHCEGVVVLGGWRRPAQVSFLAFRRRWHPCDLPSDHQRVARGVAGALIRAIRA